MNIFVWRMNALWHFYNKPKMITDPVGIHFLIMIQESHSNLFTFNANVTIRDNLRIKCTKIIILHDLDII